MSSQATTPKLVSIVNKNHALLVYPLANKSEPKSFWSELYPRKKMRWEWDSDGDDRVADLWHRRELLSRSGKVAYLKWFRGRATFFSKEALTLLLAALRSPVFENRFLLSETKKIYQALDEHSPQSTKGLKKECDLSGKFMETTYQKAVKELFERGLVVGWGEKDEGAFPSLQMGATKHFFEEEWRRAAALDSTRAKETLAHLWGPESDFFRFFLKVEKKLVPLSGL